MATGEPLRKAVEREQELQDKQLENDIKVTQAKVKTESTVAVKNLSQASAAKRKTGPTAGKSSASSKRKKPADTKKKKAKASTKSKSKR